MKTAALRSLGCKVNAYETEGMQQILQQNGYLIVPFDTKADIYVVNTCSVTNIADHKSRQMLHRAKKLNPDAVVVAAGCYVQTGLETLKADAGVDIIIGNNEKRNIAEILEEYFENARGSGQTIEPEERAKHVPDMSKVREYEEMTVSTMSEHTRGFIKIQDGCNNFCTYCVIPYARGRIRSRQIDDVVTEARALVKGGCREIVLTGIHISSFGLDRGSNELLDLIKALNGIEGLCRIRLGSLEPMIVTEVFANGLRECDKLCPHFHLSMQSGSASVLKRMNRHYTPEEYYHVVELLRRVFDEPAITTDVIVGFPGETEEEFTESYEFCKKVNFYELHVFKYSKRDGTVAAAMTDQIEEREKSRRSEKLIALGNEMSRKYRLGHMSMVRDVLFEEKKTIDGVSYWVGYTPEYIQAAVPENEVAKAPGNVPEADLSNTIVRGVLDGMVNDETVCFKKFIFDGNV